MACPSLFLIYRRCLLGALTLVVGSLAAQPQFDRPVELGVVRNSPLKEASGVAASRVQPGVLYTHNDSASVPTLVAISTEGNHLATFPLSGFATGDFEDIAVGPGPDPDLSYVYLGDIGDNRINRSQIIVYRLPEPWVDLAWAANPISDNPGGVESFQLQYPDQAHDAETLLVDPIDRQLFVLTKESGTSQIYKIGLDSLFPDQINTLEWVGRIPFHQASGGDISADGRQIVIRQEDFARWWDRPEGMPVEQAFQDGMTAFAPVVGRPTEPNGEAAGFSTDGNGYYTLSDSTTTPSLYYIRRNTPPFGLSDIELVSAGSQWRYLDDGSNQGTAWRAPSFQDSGWKLGSGAFGYGDDRLNTVVKYGSSSKKKYVTTYFRRAFTVDSVADLDSLELRLLMDDGCAIYLNGVLLMRPNLPASATYTTLASSEQNSLESCWFRYGLPPGILRAGVNTLAVEMHQFTVDSKDLRFDLQLIAKPNPSTRFVGFEHSASQTLLRVLVPTLAPTTIEMSSDLLNWEPMTTFEPVDPINEVIDPNPAGQRRYYRVAR